MNVYLKLVARYAAKFGYKQTDFRDNRQDDLRILLAEDAVEHGRTDHS